MKSMKKMFCTIEGLMLVFGLTAWAAEKDKAEQKEKEESGH